MALPAWGQRDLWRGIVERPQDTQDSLHRGGPTLPRQAGGDHYQPIAQIRGERRDTALARQIISEEGGFTNGGRWGA